MFVYDGCVNIKYFDCIVLLCNRATFGWHDGDCQILFAPNKINVIIEKTEAFKLLDLELY